jgi:hypothetical protein
MGAWDRTGLEATIIVVSSPHAKARSFELEHNSTVSWHSCSPVYITRLATLLDTCAGVPPQVVPSSLRDLSVQAIVLFPLRVS